MNVVKISLAIVVTLLFSQIIHAQNGLVGNGQVIKQQRTIGSFNKLAVRVGMRVRIVAGDATKADLEGESNVLEHVITNVKNGELTVMLSEKQTFKQTKTVTVTIHVANLNRILVSTGCSVESDIPIQSESLATTVETGSRLITAITTKKLDLTVKEGSQANLKGTATVADIHLSGAGKLQAEKLTITQATIQLDGASRADIHVTETLSASADGVSTINYTGNPTVKSQDATGLSKIRKQS
ncbi:head GIN domain-containing protein [Spirosoma sp.]|uniref:head GIN domain-containing protein n=1 Tax=Spirosoma sp. TaxID=1899569 RepID=UPI003B3ABEB7